MKTANRTSLKTAHGLEISFQAKQMLERVLKASNFRLIWNKTKDSTKLVEVLREDILTKKLSPISSQDGKLEVYGQLIEVFLLDITSRNVALLDLGIRAFAGDTIHLDAIVSDGDEKAIKSLIQAEGLVNHLFIRSGFSLEVMIYEAFERCKVNNSLLKSVSEHAQQTATH